MVIGTKTAASALMCGYIKLHANVNIYLLILMTNTLPATVIVCTLSNVLKLVGVTGIAM